MHFTDFFSGGGNRLMEVIKIALFRTLPKGAQIAKVKWEINSRLLKWYGKLTKLEIDKDSRTINLDLDLKGEKELIQVKLTNYRLLHEDGQNPVFDPGGIEVSREWLNALLKTLLKTNVIPERIEVKDAFQQAVVKSLL